jgi:3-methyladenine DNA glycosylase AlkC
MEPLKELFNRAFYECFAAEFGRVYRDFDPTAFVSDVTSGFEELSLNERLRNTSVQLFKQLPRDFNKAVDVMYEVIPCLPTGYTTLVFPDFVAQYGQQHVERSMEALKFFTRFGSSEFAIRTFLKNDFHGTLPYLYQWAGDENHHVRRLASEGSRPRLPWSFKLPEVISDPKLTQPILERLNADPELYVRKSVANHLNDFSKDNPGYMLELVSRWDRSNPHTAWIVKHGTRTLIKKGNAASLDVFGFEKDVRVRIDGFSLGQEQLRLGETLAFGFTVVPEKDTPQKLVIDYVIHYRKSSGELSPKVFKLKELELLASHPVTITKKQVIKDFSTRKHFAGEHILEIQVNGKILGKKSFWLDL